MSTADELERLERLRHDGTLSEEEFQRAKAEVLANSSPLMAAQGKSLEEQRKQWAMFLHFSLLAGLIVPFAGLVLPIVIWALNKDKFPELRPHWVVVANWIISSLIYGIVGFITIFIVVGFFILAALAIAGIVFPIVGGIKSTEGTVWKYPLSIPFLKE